MYQLHALVHLVHCSESNELFRNLALAFSLLHFFTALDVIIAKDGNANHYNDDYYE